MLTIYLLRHGRTLGNERGAYMGRTDEPLSETGRSELMGYVGLYPAVEAVYASPMKRCLETAAILYPKAEIRVIEEFREYDFGAFEAKTHGELDGLPSYRAWTDAEGRPQVPGGEDLGAFEARCAGGFEKVACELFERRYETAAIVAHGGTAMTILNRFSPAEGGLFHWRPENCEGFVLSLERDSWETNRALHRIERVPLRDAGRF